MLKKYEKILKGKSQEYLLGLYAELLLYLKNLKTIRTTNSPTGDYAEYIACKLFKLKPAPNSTKSYDAKDRLGKKYQVKSRRITQHNKSHLLGVIRGLKQADFNYLVVVIFNEDFTLSKVYKMPKNIVAKYARYSKHQNGHLLTMKGAILKDPKLEIKYKAKAEDL